MSVEISDLPHLLSRRAGPVPAAAEYEQMATTQQIVKEYSNNTCYPHNKYHITLEVRRDNFGGNDLKAVSTYLPLPDTEWPPAGRALSTRQITTLRNNTLC